MGNRVEIWLVEHDGKEISEVIVLWAHRLGEGLAEGFEGFVEFAVNHVSPITFHKLGDARTIASLLILWDYGFTHVLIDEIVSREQHDEKMKKLARAMFSLPDIRPRGFMRDVDYYVYRMDIYSYEQHGKETYRKIIWDFKMYHSLIINWNPDPCVHPIVDFKRYKWRDEELLFRAKVYFIMKNDEISHNIEKILDEI